MLQSIEIENLRGIRHGRLDELTPLVVLTGKNGSGKSTILDAITIAASDDIPNALGHIVRRHPDLRSAAEWVVKRGSSRATLRATNSLGEGRSVARELGLKRLGKPFEIGTQIFQEMGEAGPHVSIHCEARTSDLAPHLPRPGWIVTFAPDNRSNIHTSVETSISSWGGSALMGPSRSVPLTRVYSNAVQLGRRKAALDALHRVARDIQGLEILTDPEEKPQLHALFESGSVPVELIGDGLRTLIRVILELATVSGGIVLLEEPEVHQHPGAIWESARAIWDAIERGIQVVASTHSLEFIDALMSESPDPERLSVYTVRLEAGELHSARTAGSDVRAARQVIEADLR